MNEVSEQEREAAAAGLRSKAGRGQSMEVSQFREIVRLWAESRTEGGIATCDECGKEIEARKLDIGQQDHAINAGVTKAGLLVIGFMTVYRAVCPNCAVDLSYAEDVEIVSPAVVAEFAEALQEPVTASGPEPVTAPVTITETEPVTYPVIDLTMWQCGYATSIHHETCPKHGKVCAKVSTE